MEGQEHKSVKNWIKNLWILHAVGVVGLSLPWTREIFQFLTPFNLLLTTLIVFRFHKGHSVKFWVIMALVFFGGFGLEVAGVKTGLVFGEYAYGGTLGPKLFEVPLTIGLMWLVLVYSSEMVLMPFIENKWIRIPLGAILMVGLDFFIEPIAIEFDFWSWAGGDPPLQNYIGWFAGALVLKTLYAIVLPSYPRNRVAGTAYLVQLAFFLALLVVNFVIGRI